MSETGGASRPASADNIPDGRSRRIPALDGLRGIAILLVLTVHYFVVVPGPANSAIYPRLQQACSLGYSGVDLFFVLSGFLIGGILLDHRSSPRLLPSFYARRFFRIVPAYVLLLASFYVCRTIPGLNATNYGTYFSGVVPTWSFWAFVQNVMMASKHDIGPYWLGATWSLAVEEQFYLLTPFLVQRFSPRLIGWICVVVIGASPWLRLQALDGAGNPMAAVFLLPTRADGLLFGVLCAMLIRNPAVVAIIRRHDWLLRATIILLGVGFAVGSWQNYPADSRPMILFGYSLLNVLFSAVLLHVVLFPSAPLARLLTARPLVTIGLTSYFIYLFHTPIWYLLHWFLLHRPPLHYDWHAGAVTLLALLLTFVAARLSMRWFEGPLLRFGRRVSYE
ncbi:MAG TPA: acyltransferase [Opitutus sp.]|nr:acyltransferase [Opitutus sp.]